MPGDRRDDLREEVLLEPEVERVAGGPADEASHDVPLGLVAGTHAVDGEERRSAKVVGDHSHRTRLVLVALARQFLELLDDRPQQPDPEDVAAVHGRGGDAREAAAVVDVAAGQWLESGLGSAVLHEDGVAELDEPPAVAVLVALRPVGGVVLDVGEQVEHLGVGAARLPHGHLLRGAAAAPPVLLAVEGDSRAAGPLLRQRSPRCRPRPDRRRCRPP